MIPLFVPTLLHPGQSKRAPIVSSGYVPRAVDVPARKTSAVNLSVLRIILDDVDDAVVVVAGDGDGIVRTFCGHSFTANSLGDPWALVTARLKQTHREIDGAYRRQWTGKRNTFCTR